jgi:predicted 2-oxoglutarate/Fe(II)-dependent dioxygenase YbiX
MNEIKAGDIVCLKSDFSHTMTVIAIESHYARVIWHSPLTDKLERDKIEVAALIKAA